MVQENSDKKIGVIYFALFALFIAAGVVVKRVYGHPEFMMMFHLPAAVFLVLAGIKITVKLRRIYQEQQRRNS